MSRGLLLVAREPPRDAERITAQHHLVRLVVAEHADAVQTTILEPQMRGHDGTARHQMPRVVTLLLKALACVPDVAIEVSHRLDSSSAAGQYFFSSSSKTFCAVALAE